MMLFKSPLSRMINSSDFKKRLGRLCGVLVFCFCLGLNIFYRLTPVLFPELHRQAKQLVDQEIHEKINDDIDQNFSHLNDQAKQTISKKLTSEALKNKNHYQARISNKFDELKKTYQNDHGQTYLLEVDPYQWLRLTENVIKHGHAGDQLINGISHDSLMLAPFGLQITSQQFFFHLSAFLYRITHFFFPVLSLESFAFYLPLFFIIIFITLLYAFMKSQVSHMAALFTTIYVGLNPILILRSSAGWFDFDILSLILPLMIVWMILLALKHDQRLIKMIFFSLLASFFQGLYAWTWAGWWVIFLVVISALLLQIINDRSIYANQPDILKSQNIKYLIVLSTFTLGNIIFCFLLARVNLIKEIFYQIKAHLPIGHSMSTSIWPNTYYTVNELQPLALIEISRHLHGNILTFLLLSGLLWLFIKERQQKNKDLFYIVFIWTLSSVFLSLKSIRFIIFLALPIGIFFGWALHNLYLIIKDIYLRNKTDFFSFIFTLSASIVIISFLCVSALKIQLYPIMTRSWDKALTHIKENTPHDAIINSWWDYGSLFKKFAKRRVLFDGQSQNLPVSYWMARVLITPSEYEALRILHMLNNASYKTFDKINGHLNNPFRSITLLNTILKINKKETAAILKALTFPESLSDDIMQDIFTTPQYPAYIIIEKSMIPKMSNISFIGNWNFVKRYIHEHIAKHQTELFLELKELFNLSAEKSTQLLQEILLTPKGKSTSENISQRYAFLGWPQKGASTDQFKHFSNGLIVHQHPMNAMVYSQASRKFIQPSVIYSTNNEKIIKQELNNGDKTLGAILFDHNDQHLAVLGHPYILDSLFSRLYFFNGAGLKHFQPFYADDQAGIFIYKIQWDIDHGL